MSPRKPVPSEAFTDAAKQLPLAASAAASAEEWPRVPALGELGYTAEEVAQARRERDTPAEIPADPPATRLPAPLHHILHATF